MNENINPDREEILSWLNEQDEERLTELWRQADAVRREHVGDEVHLRGIIEISNRCSRFCRFCGINASVVSLKRYTMTHTEILTCVKIIEKYGYKTVVLQSGEDHRMKTSWMTSLIDLIRKNSNIIITLSLGERPGRDLAEWKRAGADRYLLKFETSNHQLYEAIHSGRHEGWQKRLEVLDILDHLDYEIGSGIMIGIPGQTWADLANDILMFQKLKLDMIGIGPFIPHPGTHSGRMYLSGMFNEQQVPNDEMTTYKTLALARLACPETNIPSTTALHTLNLKHGREFGLQRGANVIMPNFTPVRYRVLYDIYPGKTEVSETFDEIDRSVRESIRLLGRKLATHEGTSESFKTKHAKYSTGIPVQKFLH